MLDDPAGTVRALPSVRAYDRREVEAFLAAAEEHERALRARLAAARQRRVQADQVARERAGQAPELTTQLQHATAELERDLEARQAAHDAAVAALADTTARTVEAILGEAEAEARRLRASLDGDAVPTLHQL